jgi:hypothetical protein
LFDALILFNFEKGYSERSWWGRIEVEVEFGGVERRIGPWLHIGPATKSTIFNSILLSYKRCRMGIDREKIVAKGNQNSDNIWFANIFMLPRSMEIKTTKSSCML